MKYDDHCCYEVDESNIVSSSAYILIYKLRDDINTNYFKLIKGLIDTLGDGENYYIGEPVKSEYGDGFVEGIKNYEGQEHVHVKYRFGRGVLKY